MPGFEKTSDIADPIFQKVWYGGPWCAMRDAWADL